MSKRHQTKARASKVIAATDAARKSFMFGDSFENFAARVGLQANNQNAASHYTFDGQPQPHPDGGGVSIQLDRWHGG